MLRALGPARRARIAPQIVRVFSSCVMYESNAKAKLMLLTGLSAEVPDQNASRSSASFKYLISRALNTGEEACRGQRANESSIAQSAPKQQSLVRIQNSPGTYKATLTINIVELINPA